MERLKFTAQEIFQRINNAREQATDDSGYQKFPEYEFHQETRGFYFELHNNELSEIVLAGIECNGRLNFTDLYKNHESPLRVRIVNCKLGEIRFYYADFTLERSEVDEIYLKYSWTTPPPEDRADVDLNIKESKVGALHVHHIKAVGIHIEDSTVQEFDFSLEESEERTELSIRRTEILKSIFIQWTVHWNDHYIECSESIAPLIRLACPTTSFRIIRGE